MDRDSSDVAHLDDYLTAEAQWVRTLAVWRRLGEHSGLVSTLTALGDLYLAWGREHRALDAFTELLWRQREADDAHGMAVALSRLGETLLAARRWDAAVDELRRSAEAFSALDSPDPARHVATLLTLGRAQWQLGRPRLAKRSFSAALAMCVGRDEEAADQIRLLLNTDTTSPLPYHR
jgi:tetratricopeptide (TPR) repeat protein